MLVTPVFMDNHSTTRVDPRVVAAMLPYFDQMYGNPGSSSHVYGWDARDAVDAARQTIAAAVGASSREIVFTSGATESNNLALRGAAERLAHQGRHIVSVTTEHKAVLDPLRRLERSGYEVSWLPVEPAGSPRAGLLDVGRLVEALRVDTTLVSVMLANNEIGAIQPLAEIGQVCRERGVLLHCDATQAVGKIPVDVAALQLDLMSFSAHKMYGPKGVGALYVRRSSPPVRLWPLLEGGGQEFGLRGGTLNVPGIVGFAAALRLCLETMADESQRLRAMRQRLFDGLTERAENVQLNGPGLDQPAWRLAGNLNLSFAYVEGEALMLSMRELALSSGSACTSASPEPSHVLRALGLTDDQVRGALRFGLGRFNTPEEVEFAIETIAEAATRLRRLSSLA